MLRRYGNFPGFTESWGRLRSIPTTSKRCVSRLYLISGITTGFHGTNTVGGGVQATDSLLLLTLGLFSGREHGMCRSGDALIVRDGLDQKVIRLPFRRMPFLATNL